MWSTYLHTSEELAQCAIAHILRGCVNFHVPKTVRHGNSLHIICPKLLIDSSPCQIEYQTSVRMSTDDKTIWLKSYFTWVPNVCPSTDAKLFWLESYLTRVPGVCPLTITETIWLQSQLSVLWPTQKLLTHIPTVCPLNVAISNDSHPRRLSSDCYRN